jgi:colanic acid biosynthesis protein WcaH
MAPVPLNHADLSIVVRLTPLVSIDLVIRNPQNQVLLGFRNNEPAKGSLFIPGGIIWKNERVHQAFARIVKNETNWVASLDEARWLGVFEHFYPNNRFGEAGYGTHYVALGYELKLNDVSGLKGDAQHSKYGWWDEADLLASEDVHEYTKAYLR